MSYSSEFLIPNNIEVEPVSPPFHSRIILEPFEPGCAYALQNTFRRFLLSAMPGCAPTEVKIKGASHEYSTIPGVWESVADILLNLKELYIRIQGRDEVVLTVNKKGPGVLLARDIALPHDVVIINSDHIIATLNEAVTLEMEITVRRGRGYEPVATRFFGKEISHTVGILQLDAVYSPVKRVNCSVENIRVEHRTNLERLVIDLVTNGTLTPEEAIQQTAALLRKQLAPLVEILGKETEGGFSDQNTVFFQPLDYLPLSVRALNCLRGEGILHVGDLVQKQEIELLKTPNLGKRSIDEIKEVLSQFGLFLGMQLDNWPPSFLPRSKLSKIKTKKKTKAGKSSKAAQADEGEDENVNSENNINLETEKTSSEQEEV